MKPSTRRRHGRAAPVIVALAVAALTASCAGSDGPAVANISSPASTTSTTASAPNASALAYAQCMRAHGLPTFPDPDSSGHLSIDGGPGSGIDAESAGYKSAAQACESLLPGQSGPHFTPNREQTLAYAKCMRSHGIKDFPDPNPDGTFDPDGGGDLDPNSPRFQDANAACKQYLPDGGRQQGAGGS